MGRDRIELAKYKGKSVRNPAAPPYPWYVDDTGQCRRHLDWYSSPERRRKLAKQAAIIAYYQRKRLERDGYSQVSTTP